MFGNWRLIIVVIFQALDSSAAMSSSKSTRFGATLAIQCSQSEVCDVDMLMIFRRMCSSTSHRRGGLSTPTIPRVSIVSWYMRIRLNDERFCMLLVMGCQNPLVKAAGNLKAIPLSDSDCSLTSMTAGQLDANRLRSFSFKRKPWHRSTCCKKLAANLYLVISRVSIWSPVLEASYDLYAKNCGSFSQDGYIEPSHLALEAQSACTGQTSAFLEQ